MWDGLWTTIPFGGVDILQAEMWAFRRAVEESLRWLAWAWSALVVAVVIAAISDRPRAVRCRHAGDSRAEILNNVHPFRRSSLPAPMLQTKLARDGTRVDLPFAAKARTGARTWSSD